MVEDFELVNTIVNGYWYTFDYEYLKSKRSIGYDDVPLVYVFAPHKSKPNLFWAINLHHVGDRHARQAFVEKMQSDSGFMNDETRHVYTEEGIARLSNSVLKMAARCYDKTKCRNIYRVKNKGLGKYILIDGNLTMSNPSQEEIKWNLDHRKESKNTEEK